MDNDVILKTNSKYFFLLLNIFLYEFLYKEKDILYYITMKGSVYKIVNTQNDYVYVGSTKQTLSRRMATHRSACKRGNNKKLYKMMRRIGVEHFKIVLLEIVEFEDIYELRKKEDDYIGKFEKKTNMRKAVRINENTNSAIKAFKIHKRRLNQKTYDEQKHHNLKDVDTPVKDGYMKRCCLCNTLFVNRQEIKRHYKSAKHKKKCKMFAEFKYNEVIGELHRIFD